MTKKPKSSKLRIDIAKILEILPQRYPMLMLDRVTELVRGEYIKGHKNVSANEPWCQGHFPGKPVMPGVLQIEALAQLSVVLVYATEPFDARSSQMYFLGIDKAKFRHTVTPGDRLELQVEVLQHRSNVWRVRGEATVRGTLCAQAELTASVVDR